MSVHTMIIALFSALALTLGSVGTLSAPPATATPGGPTVTQVSDFPFDGSGTDDGNSPNASKRDKKSEKAEKLSGGVATKVIDLIAGVIKCGLNIATPSVKCQL